MTQHETGSPAVEQGNSANMEQGANTILDQVGGTAVARMFGDWLRQRPSERSLGQHDRQADQLPRPLPNLAHQGEPQQTIERAAEVVTRIDYFTPDGAEHMRRAVADIEDQTQVSVLDWLSWYRQQPTDCPKPIVEVLQNGVLAALHKDAAMDDFFAMGNTFTDYRMEDIQRLTQRLSDSLVLSLGPDVRLGDGSTRAALLASFRHDLMLYGMERLGPRQRGINQEGAKAVARFVETVQSIGAGQAERLFRVLGVANFSRWPVDMLQGTLAALADQQPVERSLLLTGRSSDHNAASSAFFHMKGLSGVIPIEVEHPDAIVHVLGNLQYHNVRVRRLTLAGHGDAEGVRLSSSDKLPNDPDLLRQHPLRDVIERIEPDANGRRIVNLIACSAARRFAGQADSFAGSFAKAYRDLDVEVRASSGLMRPAQYDTLEQGVVQLETIRPLLQYLMERYNKGWLGALLEDQAYRRRTDTIITSSHCMVIGNRRSAGPL